MNQASSRYRLIWAAVAIGTAGLAANLGGAAMAWMYGDPPLNDVFVSIFEGGVILLSLSACLASIAAIVRPPHSAISRWVLGIAAGAIAGLAVGACAAYWPWFLT